MAFEFDPDKSRTNKIKHGIDLVEAQRLWIDRFLISFPARGGLESRFVAVGQIDGKHWSAICTRRHDNIRIISVRRSRKEEIALYEGK
ncbi:MULTISPECIES: BrnT family toxin [unclassified Rhizobium]|uniref:BrnT family toxin n=1 Tax=unclassified Rhizobium TaxID=2613769 RepID=UPI001ADC85A9|nr:MULTISPECIES: BrnT family toxin [unclassified Rhizobium]MBO9099082.1 BrnT family toxin [Rhizobium sp. L58/93]MBO9132111.1 BrnT family toxin [Rhizobium sp. B209b/85]MBO9169345.1 BrnT family toxin [Rhizobium sp. L245/93]MBO9185297.1 BrnT family toxin [Rhizobium sp. E27B/91]QXZ85437.1 BrnT family toxin [Rhizobium sp. K1/93]